MSDKNLDDASNFKIVNNAFKTLEMPIEEQNSLIEIVASVLHLGNITFGEDELSKATVYENEHVHAISNVSSINFMEDHVSLLFSIFLK